MFRVFRRCLSLPRVRRLYTSAVSRFGRVSIRRFLFRGRLSTFLRPRVANVRVQPTFLYARSKLFLFPYVCIFLISKGRRLQRLFPIPRVQSKVLQVFRGLSIREFNRNQLFVSGRSQGRTYRYVSGRRNYRLTTHRCVVASKGMVYSRFLGRTLVGTLMVPTWRGRLVLYHRFPYFYLYGEGSLQNCVGRPLFLVLQCLFRGALAYVVCQLYLRRRPYATTMEVVVRPTVLVLHVVASVRHVGVCFFLLRNSPYSTYRGPLRRRVQGGYRGVGLRYPPSIWHDPNDEYASVYPTTASAF